MGSVKAYFCLERSAGKRSKYFITLCISSPLSLIHCPCQAQSWDESFSCKNSICTDFCKTSGHQNKGFRYCQIGQYKAKPTKNWPGTCVCSELTITDVLSSYHYQDPFVERHFRKVALSNFLVSCPPISPLPSICGSRLSWLSQSPPKSLQSQSLRFFGSLGFEDFATKL